MTVKLLTENQMEFLSLKGCCRGLSESRLSKCQIVGNLMPRINYDNEAGRDFNNNLWS